MNQQPMGTRRALQIARRYKTLIAVAAVVGAVGGVGYGALTPQTFTSEAIVVLQAPAAAVQTTDPVVLAATQAVVLTSDPVLSSSLSSLHSNLPIDTFRADIVVSSPGPGVLAVDATGATAGEAEDYANAVAQGYVNYTKKNESLVGDVSANVLQSAATATSGSSVGAKYASMGLIGALAGAVLGFVLALSLSRADRRLRDRGEIANSIGLPVLAALPVEHAADAADWARLFQHYDPGAVGSWQLRRLVEQLGLVDDNLRSHGSNSSVIVVTTSPDRKALALGPQLAVFTASLGIPTTLLVGSQQDTAAVATLHTACAALADGASQHSRYLQIAVSEPHGRIQQPDKGLTIGVVVVDGDGPHVPPWARSSVAILGVSAGAVRAEHLARAATAIADSGGYVLGVLVADPDPSDRTTGLDTYLGGPTQRRAATRLNGMPMETRR
jgi:capsular polysaccharide biosynthesis protein